MLSRMRGFLIYYTRGSRIGATPRTVSTLVEAAITDSHMGGIPRRIVMTTIGALTKFYGIFLNDTKVHNKDTLLSLVKSRPPGTPLVTVSNHMSTLDDPLMWGMRGMPLGPKLGRWTLAAEDICFTNWFFSYFFRLGKCIPVTRGAGIYQPHMAEALQRVNEGHWLNTFPEGKICQQIGPLRRLKWGTASLIARAKVSPIVLPIGHSGFEKVIPEDWWNGKRPLIPLWNKKVDIVIGEPMQFDIQALSQVAFKWARAPAGVGYTSGFGSSGYNPHPLPYGVRRCSSFLQVAETLDTMRTNGVDVPESLLDEAAWRWMYTHITEHIWVALSDVTEKARTLNRLRAGS